MRYGLSPITIQALQRVFKAHPVIEEVLIYGSRASKNHHPGSDIDLTLKGKNLSFKHLLELKTQIEDLNLVYEVDLSIYDQLKNPALLSQIDHFGQTFYPSKTNLF